MFSLREGTDNRMLVLENMMRDLGGDKMKALVRVCVCVYVFIYIYVCVCVCVCVCVYVYSLEHVA